MAPKTLKKCALMRKLLFFIFTCFALSFFSCSGEKKPDDAAAKAAKGYYDSLFAKNYACYVRGMYLPDTIPPGYREQLEANASMFVGRMESEHRGVNGVKILRFVNDTVVSADKKSHVRVADVFLVLNFGDSLNEEVVVPMIFHKGRWLMR